MNERIKELSEQAGFAQWTWQQRGSQEERLQKFAELLVVKCANVVWDEAEKTNSKEINEVGYKLLKHFGVE